MKRQTGNWNWNCNVADSGGNASPGILPQPGMRSRDGRWNCHLTRPAIWHRCFCRMPFISSMQITCTSRIAMQRRQRILVGEFRCRLQVGDRPAFFLGGTALIRPETSDSHLECGDLSPLCLSGTVFLSIGAGKQRTSQFNFG